MERIPFSIVAVLIIIALVLPIGGYAVSSQRDVTTPQPLENTTTTWPQAWNETTLASVLTNNSGDVVSSPYLAQGQYPIDAGTSGIEILQPTQDLVDNGVLFIAGRVSDPGITFVTVDVNGTESEVPVQDGIFSGFLYLSGPARVIISANGGGQPIYREMAIDGDGLPEPYELICGFDPLNPDSDAGNSVGDEGDNGIADGLELLDGKLPAFIKCKAGLHPVEPDTDRDLLTDYFELASMGRLADPVLADTDGNGITDAREDPDFDGLTNYREQEYGTDPLAGN